MDVAEVQEDGVAMVVWVAKADVAVSCDSKHAHGDTRDDNMRDDGSDGHVDIYGNDHGRADEVPEV